MKKRRRTTMLDRIVPTPDPDTDEEPVEPMRMPADESARSDPFDDDSEET
jgi:hypothetical protein